MISRPTAILIENLDERRHTILGLNDHPHRCECRKTATKPPCSIENNLVAFHARRSQPLKSRQANQRS